LIVKVGSRLEAEMKLRSEKQVALPKIEIDLSKIQQLSHEHDEENWEFRSWLKQYAPDDIDVLVKSLSRKYFTLIDCTWSAEIAADHCTSNLKKVSFTSSQKRLVTQ
jgi:hypothetical protein